MIQINFEHDSIATLLLFCTQKIVVDVDDYVTLGANNLLFFSMEKFWEPRLWFVEEVKLL